MNSVEWFTGASVHFGRSHWTGGGTMRHDHPLPTREAGVLYFGAYWHLYAAPVEAPEEPLALVVTTGDV